MLRWNSALAEQANALFGLTLEKDPARRLQSAEELAVGLGRLSGDAHSSTENETPKQSEKTRGDAAYSLPDLGFRRQPEGQLDARAQVFRWVQKPPSLPPWPKVRIPERQKGFGPSSLVTTILSSLPMMGSLIPLALLIIFLVGSVAVCRNGAYYLYTRGISRHPECIHAASALPQLPFGDAPQCGVVAPRQRYGGSDLWTAGLHVGPAIWVVAGRG